MLKRKNKYIIIFLMRMEGRNILIIDENDKYQDFYTMILEQESYIVVKAHSVKEAISNLFGENIELILLDIDLPKIGGLKMLEIIRRHKKTKDIPLIMLSSAFCEKDIRLSQKYGADLCMEKPSLVSDVLNSVDCLLNNKHELVS